MNKEKMCIIFLIIVGLVITLFLGGKIFKEGFSTDNKQDIKSTTERKKSELSQSTNQQQSSQTTTNFDNYNHFTGTSSSLTNEKTFYGPNGGTAVITTNSDGTQVLKVTLSTNDNPITFTQSKFNLSGEIFYGPHGGTATIVDNNGTKAIIVKNKNGVFIYKLQDQNKDISQYDISSTQYFGSTGYTTYPFKSTAYTDDNYQANSMNSTINNMANTISDALKPTSSPQPQITSSTYASSLPKGIPRSQIPSGQEDLYILKSEVVPPVCPACPAAASCPRQEPCPACPPCGRCPEPSFECKKVPNYNAISSQYLPAPFVNSFASFGK